MRQTKLFTKTRKEAPKDEVAKNAQLLIRAGYIHKEMAGVYSYLPLGLRTLKKIEHVIREEMNAIDGQELFLSALHPKEVWEATGRWDGLDVLFKLKDTLDREYALGATHEEIITPLAQEYITSYRDLPFAAYQFQNKFRAEVRSKSGIMRGREFIMKDLYSFHTSQEDLDAYYERAIEAYKKIFARCGLGEKTYLTFASGGTFSKYSHEFQTLTDAGEDIIHTCEACAVAVNEEILADQPTCPTCKGALVPQKAVETGNIFKLGTKYSSAFNLTFKDAQGVAQPVIMGCYGIGLGRVMGTVVEVLSDEKGIVWPRTIAPFHIHLISIEGKSPETAKEAERLYKELSERGIEVLWDDRDVRAGEKFADADLIGIPHRLVVSDRSLAEGGFELTDRASGTSRMVPEGEVFDVLARL
jgi:prolyl-tRNA synthetase